MNIYGNSPTTGYTDSGLSCPYVPAFSCKRVGLQEEETLEFSTIDGDVITYNDGTLAVSSGSGIFIGDYFVGLTDSHTSIQAPFVRY
ncbi:hypothetical protein [Pontibacter ruber]|uniref:Peptidase A1 domain-containing protein n=1 Tax=Pontibacter ruber TaxID=1343895 RepID=A0ABW5CSC1_9BACT|nr:hypothetical protein [Pontibacter ruber]